MCASWTIAENHKEMWANLPLKTVKNSIWACLVAEQVVWLLTSAFLLVVTFFLDQLLPPTSCISRDMPFVVPARYVWRHKMVLAQTKTTDQITRLQLILVPSPHGTSLFRRRSFSMPRQTLEHNIRMYRFSATPLSGTRIYGSPVSGIKPTLCPVSRVFQVSWSAEAMSRRFFPPVPKCCIKSSTLTGLILYWARDWNPRLFTPGAGKDRRVRTAFRREN